MSTAIVLYAIVFMSNGHVGAIQKVQSFDTMAACKAEGIRQNEEEPDITGEIIWMSKNFRLKDQFEAGMHCRPESEWEKLKTLTLKTDKPDLGKK